MGEGRSGRGEEWEVRRGRSGEGRRGKSEDIGRGREEEGRQGKMGGKAEVRGSEIEERRQVEMREIGRGDSWKGWKRKTGQCHGEFSCICTHRIVFQNQLTEVYVKFCVVKELQLAGIAYGRQATVTTSEGWPIALSHTHTPTCDHEHTG